MQVAGWPEREIGAIAVRQRGLITRPQLTALGVTRAAIDHAIVRGRLHRVHHAVYSLVPFPALPPLAAELAAVLACGDAALLSHHSAAATWGFRPSFTGLVHVTAIGSDAGRERPGLLAALRQSQHPRTRGQRQGRQLHRRLSLAPRESDRRA
jgi:hypothetical protein